MTKWIFILVVTTITFFTLGIALGAALQNKYTVAIQRNTANAQVTDIWDKMDTFGCSDVDTALGMTAGKCSALMNPCSVGSVVSLTCSAGGKTDISMTFAIPGQWVPD